MLVSGQSFAVKETQKSTSSEICFHLSTVCLCRLNHSPTSDNACLSAVAFSFFLRQKYTHSPCDIISPSVRVYFQMSGACPEECHATSGRILDEEESVGPGCTGYPQTVNKDQTTLTAFRFQLNVFRTLSVGITAGELLDKPQWPRSREQLPLLFFKTKAADQFCHYTCLLWLSLALCIFHSCSSGPPS